MTGFHTAIIYQSIEYPDVGAIFLFADP